MQLGHLKRREFITLLGAAAAWPMAARAQQPERMRRIGVLLSPAADDLEYQGRIAAFQQALQQLGWTDAPRNEVILPHTALPQCFALASMLAQGEARKNGISVVMALGEGLPCLEEDRIHFRRGGCPAPPFVARSAPIIVVMGSARRCARSRRLRPIRSRATP